ncbi:MAG TPA: lysine--tRNA ligase [Candidatus Omnitrophica bacterium]|nr:lysine--tRNA ligase [Candidatus Omnitrophota bacterium]
MLGDILSVRQEKLKNLKKEGIDPFGKRFATDGDIKSIIDSFSEHKKVNAAGRIINMRVHGGSIFSDLRDFSGKIQVYFKKDVLGEDKFKLIESLDIGDILGVEGELFNTKRGEITISVSSFTVLAKSLKPLPEKWHGLKDIEIRYRQRYLDLISNEDSRKIFLLRSRFITKIRSFFDERGYIEVETPMLQPVPGGAAGRPFKTHHNVYDADLYMRIAPELYLKRLLVGGMNKVYEINKSFRNEGISPRHNPEFTMLEAYTSYADYEDMINITEELVFYLAKEILGSSKISYKGKDIDLTPPWKRISFADVMKQNYDITPDDDLDIWVKKLKQKGVEIEKGDISRTKLINIIGDVIEPEQADKPVFVLDYFTELCPLAKAKKENPALTERFELYMAGLEIANAYSELNDPIQQRERFKEQAEGGNIDEDFVQALEYGMPPAGGLGIGIDRLVMIFSGAESIRDVILFPQLKPEKQL